MRLVLAPVVLALGLGAVACAPPADPAPPVTVSVAPSPSVATAAPTAGDVLFALCTKMKASPGHPPVALPTARDPLDDEAREALVRAIRPSFPRRQGLRVGRAPSARGGRLVDVSYDDPMAGNASGQSGALVLLASSGAVSKVEGTLVDVRDFDGDGTDEALVSRCAPSPLFGQDCSFAVWFASGTVELREHLTGDRTFEVATSGARFVLDIVPADANLGELALPEDVTRVSFARTGATRSDGHERFANDLPAARRSYALELCGDGVSTLDLSARRGRLVALGASDPEAARILASLPRYDEPTPPSAATDARPDPSADVWKALPPAIVAECKEPAGKPATELRAEAIARVRASATARLADLDGPVTVTFGCRSQGATPFLVEHDERSADTPSLRHAELFLHTKDRTTKIAGARSRWRGEWHHVKSLTLDHSGDFDGDGERETLLGGTEIEGGAMTSMPHVAALVRGGKLLAAPSANRVVPLVASRDGLLGVSRDREPGAPFPWPPEVFELRGDRFVTAPMPARFTAATRAARDAHAARGRE